MGTKVGIRHGFRNFDNYRLRLLLHCDIDWDTPAITRIRRRLPRLIAKSQGLSGERCNWPWR
jgi:hypothetical protein